MSDNIKDLATAVWRLEKWIDNVNVERKMAAISSLRNIKKYYLHKEMEGKNEKKFNISISNVTITNGVFRL